MPYGYGNGGGGPTIEMIERGRRMRDLDGVPRLQLGATDEFFDHLEQEVADGAPVPVWRGELYFEMHRGTLTSQTQTKVGNRRCERLLREAELWWATGGVVPAEVAAELIELWNEVLLQQFHDIIPGSSIAWVHADAEAAHARVAVRLEELITEAFERLPVRGWVVANPATRARRELVASAHTPGGSGPTQLLSTGETLAVVEVPGCGIARLSACPIADRVVTTEHTMTNEHICVQWGLDGTLTSIIDVARGRELLPAGRAVTLEIAPDHPVEFDAWDLESWTSARGAPVGGVSSVSFAERGPLLAQVRVVRAFGSSTSTTTYTVRAGSARLDIGFDIDWHEDEQLLSLMVPLDVRAETAACDIQFGHVMRPTHASSPWDAAKFEVCAHRYVDLAEPGFGVAILNDGRYGHGLFDGGVRVSLLRAAKFPDPEADHGRHLVTISILPHGAGLHDVLREAEALNLPLRLVEGTASDAGANPGPLVTIDHPGVQLSAVKQADDGTGELVVRFYEACGDRASITVTASGRITAALRCNALEEPGEVLDASDGVVALVLRPFELVTLRLRTA
jgi:alpha-mannosidase